MLVCKGIWDCLSSQQAVNVVRLLILQARRLSQICEDNLGSVLPPMPRLVQARTHPTIYIAFNHEISLAECCVYSYAARVKHNPLMDIPTRPHLM